MHLKSRERIWRRKKNEGEWTGKVNIMVRKKILVMGEPCEASRFWPAPGFKWRTFVSSGFSTEGTIISASAVPRCDLVSGEMTNDRTDRLTDETTTESGFRFGRSEVLWSLRRYLRVSVKPRISHQWSTRQERNICNLCRSTIYLERTRSTVSQSNKLWNYFESNNKET